MKNLKPLMLSAAALLIMLCLSAGSEKSDYGLALKVSQDRFVDSHGRHVIMRGANAGSRSKLPPFYPFEPNPDFDSGLERFTGAFESLGFNVVRLLVIYEAAEPVRGSYDEEYLARYDKMVESFGRRGIRVIVDSHQDIFSRRFCGDGFPDWAIAEKYRRLPRRADCGIWELNNFKYRVAGSFDRFWNNVDGLQDSYVAFFAMLARRYRNQPAVIGFEPINEPMPGAKGALNYSEWNEKKLYGLYERVGEAVHAADPRYIIFADSCPLENLGSWSSLRARPKTSNLAFAPHYYDVGYVKFPLTTGRDREIMRNGLKKHIQLGRTWGAPVLVGEYGIEMQRDDAPRYINNLYSIFDELLLSGTIWEASMSPTLWNGRDKCIFNPDGSLRPGSVALDRPYPWAVAGVIKKFSYKPETGVFEMIFHEDPSIDLPTEIYLPERIYKDSPHVELDGEGTWDFDPERNVLAVPAMDRAAERRVKVSP